MLSQLNQQFSSDQVQFVEGEQGFVKAVINNHFAQCEIYLHGAHVTSFVPQGQEDLFWLSKQAVFVEGKSIRGGIPICWPWFGGHWNDASKGAHGFARLMDWQVVDVETTDNGATELIFRLSDTDATFAIWPFKFMLQYRVRVAEQLSVSLTTTNINKFDFQISEALHSYFSLADIHQAVIQGLDGTSYVDALNDSLITPQSGDIEIDQEVDRVYINTQDTCVLVDQTRQRNVEVTKSGSDSTIVWNPWIDKAKRMPDVNDEGYQHFMCIETANALDNVVTIGPGEQHCVSLKIALS